MPEPRETHAAIDARRNAQRGGGGDREARLREAEDEMWAWAKGERSHINEFFSLEGDQNRTATLAAVAQADAAEVSRWASAVIGLRRDDNDVSDDEVLVEGSWFARADLPKILGNFMRTCDEHGREAKALAATVQRVEALCKQWEGAAAADIGLDFQGPVRIGPIARALRSALAPSDPATGTRGEAM